MRSLKVLDVIQSSTYSKIKCCDIPFKVNVYLLKTNLYFIGLIFVFSCAPSRFVRPLEKKESAVNLSLGGPLFKYGNNEIIMPIPFMTATYGYGIDSTLTGFASLNITSGLYGNVQTELGILKQFMEQQELFPSISASLALNIIYRDPRNSRLFPQLDLFTFWEYGKKGNFFYTGVDTWLEFARKRDLEEDQQYHLFVSPLIGHTFNGEKWNFKIEAKFIAPHLSNKSMVVDYVTPVRDRGALGIYFGLTRKF